MNFDRILCKQSAEKCGKKKERPSFLQEVAHTENLSASYINLCLDGPHGISISISISY